jgi:hypothetical protein
MLKGIDVCMRAQCLVSAVGLIYSTIDVVSALTREPGKDTSREIFLQWVRSYVEPETSLNCTAEDLYGARCGILHLYCPDSNLRKKGEAKALVYKWKNGPDPSRKLPEDAIVLEVEKLRKVVGMAVNQFLGDVERDSRLKDIVQRNCTELLCYKPWETVEIFVAA